MDWIAFGCGPSVTLNIEYQQPFLPDIYLLRIKIVGIKIYKYKVDVNVLFFSEKALLAL